ncbi:MAG TPA: hypothetical protein VD865_16730 [Stenotrophomonas sp.]|nr:hypothetical protein [Stenotrophomonas sp.]
MKRLPLLAALAVAPCLAANPAEPTPVGDDPVRVQRELDYIAAPIKTRAALDAYLQRLPPDSPLLALSPPARQEFLASLVFTEHGLASYRYVPLQQIDLADAYRILALFGQQRSLAALSGMTTRTEEGKRVKAALGMP